MMQTVASLRRQERTFRSAQRCYCRYVEVKEFSCRSTLIDVPEGEI